MAAGSISEKKFAECAIHLLEKSAHQKDHWTGEKSSSGEIYLQKRCTVPCQLPIPTTRERTLSDTQNIKEPVEDLDEAIVQDNVSASTSMVTFVYHVVYNASYAVPVLYFNAYKPVVLYSYGRVQFQYRTEWFWKPSHSTDGQLLSLEEVWAIVPQHYQDRLREERWTFITQQEHPILGRPFYQLHPCHTSTLMSQIPDTPGRAIPCLCWMKEHPSSASPSMPFTQNLFCKHSIKHMAGHTWWPVYLIEQKHVKLLASCFYILKLAEQRLKPIWTGSRSPFSLLPYQQVEGRQEYNL